MRYIEHKAKKGSNKALNLLYERALKELPGRYCTCSVFVVILQKTIMSLFFHLMGSYVDLIALTSYAKARHRATNNRNTKHKIHSTYHTTKLETSHGR